MKAVKEWVVYVDGNVEFMFYGDESFPFVCIFVTTLKDSGYKISHYGKNNVSYVSARSVK